MGNVHREGFQCILFYNGYIKPLLDRIEINATIEKDIKKDIIFWITNLLGNILFKKDILQVIENKKNIPLKMEVIFREEILIPGDEISLQIEIFKNFEIKKIEKTFSEIMNIFKKEDPIKIENNNMEEIYNFLKNLKTFETIENSSENVKISEEKTFIFNEMILNSSEIKNNNEKINTMKIAIEKLEKKYSIIKEIMERISISADLEKSYIEP